MYRSSINIKGIFISAMLVVALKIPCLAQTEVANSGVSHTMEVIPDSLTHSAKAIAQYIVSHFSKERDRAYAAFIWIAGNIEYNFETILSNTLYESPSSVSDRTLQSRKGVCLNYASLYQEIANLAGIQTYMIQGYTKQSGRIDFLPHVWCVSNIDSGWHIIDPTWGSGYTNGTNFYNSILSDYFMASPEKIIRSHMPFDPMWQLLSFPLSYDNFNRAFRKRPAGRTLYNFTDTIQTWLHADEMTRAVTLAHRIERNGIKNHLVQAKLRLTRAEIVFLINKQATEIYDSASVFFNRGIRHMNQFTAYLNAQFIPVEDSLTYIHTLDLADFNFRHALELLEKIEHARENIMKAVYYLRNEVLQKYMILRVRRAYFEAYLLNKT